MLRHDIFSIHPIIYLNFNLFYGCVEFHLLPGAVEINQQKSYFSELIQYK